LRSPGRSLFTGGCEGGCEGGFDVSTSVVGGFGGCNGGGAEGGALVGACLGRDALTKPGLLTATVLSLKAGGGGEAAAKAALTLLSAGGGAISLWHLGTKRQPQLVGRGAHTRGERFELQEKTADGSKKCSPAETRHQKQGLLDPKTA